MAPRGLFAVQALSAAVDGDANWALSNQVALFAGLRADHYRFKTRALEGPDAWNGRVRDALLSPKQGASWTLCGGWALHAHAGRGVHCNGARGVTAPGADHVPGALQSMGEPGCQAVVLKPRLQAPPNPDRHSLEHHRSPP